MCGAPTYEMPRASNDRLPSSMDEGGRGGHRSECVGVVGHRRRGLPTERERQR